jgi:hypothetical protein
MRSEDFRKTIKKGLFQNSAWLVRKKGGKSAAVTDSCSMRGALFLIFGRPGQNISLFTLEEYQVVFLN